MDVVDVGRHQGRHALLQGIGTVKRPHPRPEGEVGQALIQRRRQDGPAQIVKHVLRLEALENGNQADAQQHRRHQKGGQRPGNQQRPPRRQTRQCAPPCHPEQRKGEARATQQDRRARARRRQANQISKGNAGKARRHQARMAPRTARHERRHQRQRRVKGRDKMVGIGEEADGAARRRELVKIQGAVRTIDQLQQADCDTQQDEANQQRQQPDAALEVEGQHAKKQCHGRQQAQGGLHRLRRAQRQAHPARLPRHPDHGAHRLTPGQSRPQRRRQWQKLQSKQDQHAHQPEADETRLRQTRPARPKRMIEQRQAQNLRHEVSRRGQTGPAAEDKGGDEDRRRQAKADIHHAGRAPTTG